MVLVSREDLVQEMTTSVGINNEGDRYSYFQLESLGLRHFVKANYDVLTAGLVGKAFADAYVSQHNLSVHPVGTERVPQTGSLLIVANHPGGLLDGVILGSLLPVLRGDCKVVAVEGLRRCIGDALIPVSLSAIRGDREPATRAMMLKSAALIRSHLIDQGAVVVLPGKGAGHYDPVKKELSDVPYDCSGLLEMVAAMNTPILPVFIDCRFRDEHYECFAFPSPEYFAFQWEEISNIKDREIGVVIGEPFQLAEVTSDRPEVWVHQAVHRLRPARQDAVAAA